LVKHDERDAGQPRAGCTVAVPGACPRRPTAVASSCPTHRS